MSELSPAALTMWSAFLDHYEWEVTQTELCAVAAALRALVDQVVPEEGYAESDYDYDAWKARQDLRNSFLRIAAEIDGVNFTNQEH
jgi:hypothetical protein